MSDIPMAHESVFNVSFSRSARALGDFIVGLREGYSAYRRYSVLSALNDMQLADQGLTRRDITRAALFHSNRVQ